MAPRWLPNQVAKLHRFQEQLLSRRGIYFVENQVFFRCREDIYSERLIDQDPGKGDLINDIVLSMLPLAAGMQEPLTDSEAMLIYYTRRALTNQSDILNALAGIIRRLEEKARCRFLQGLPTAAFDAFIVFWPRKGVLRRRYGFPSYSWAGWKGGLIIYHKNHRAFQNLNEWLTEDTWIIWYKRSPSGVLSLVWDPAANESFPVDDLSFQGYRERRPFHLPEGLPRSISSARTYPTEDLPFELPKFGYPILQFWTLSINFKLQVEDIFEETALILGLEGAEVGTVDLDGHDEPTFFESTDLFEFIVLSGSLSDVTLHTIERVKYFVMLLEWQGPVAQRRGLGMIEKSAILKGFPPGPQWKEIMLS